MNPSYIAYLILLSPVLYIMIAVGSWIFPGFRPKPLILLSKLTSVISLMLVMICNYFVYHNNMIELIITPTSLLNLGIRLDALSMIMISMISILAFVIVKYSSRYLDGDANQGVFMGRLAASIASVQLLVLSADLVLLFISWVVTSLTLHRLLVFYRYRAGAQIAAKKKFIMARLGDLALLLSFILLYRVFDTTNLQQIFTLIGNGSAAIDQQPLIELSALLLVTAAMLKSALFPTHGWLIEVMETPTPVSSLLHAGILNAGPFIVLRFAFVMDASSVAPVLLMLVGGFSALFASIVYLTQTSIKTALAYSSVGHMGFSLMVCGLGVYPAAMLHLVAHSFYKAHSFLSSGSVIDTIKASRIATPKTSINLGSISVGMLLSVLFFIGFVAIWGVDIYSDLPLLIIGFVITLGLSRIFISAISFGWSFRLIMRSIIMAFVILTAFFGLESLTHILLESQMPYPQALNIVKIAIAILLLILFTTAVFIQIISPNLINKPKYRVWAVHFRNGLYANVWFDRVIKSLNIHHQENVSLLDQPVLKHPFPSKNKQSN